MAVSATDTGQKNIVQGGRVARYGLRTVALGYLALLLMIPGRADLLQGVRGRASRSPGRR